MTFINTGDSRLSSPGIEEGVSIDEDPPQLLHRKRQSRARGGGGGGGCQTSGSGEGGGRGVLSLCMAVVV